MQSRMSEAQGATAEPKYVFVGRYGAASPARIRSDQESGGAEDLVRQSLGLKKKQP